MRRKLLLIAALSIITAFASISASAQTSRKSVSGAEVTGTFRYAFTGKFKGSYNEIKIQALGKGKLRVAFDLSYPFIDPQGEMSANTGHADGEAQITGDTAVYSSDEFGKCEITIKFVRPGVVKVTEDSDAAGCGFGHNVASDGTYKKFSAAKPKFEE